MIEETSLAFAFVGVECLVSLGRNLSFPATCSLASLIFDFLKKPSLDLSFVNSFETHEGHMTCR